MVVFAAASGAALVALSALVAIPSATAQVVGISTVRCMDSFGWANNSLEQNPCLVTAYLQAECAQGSFTMNPLAAGYHYIGPTNDTTTQNPCICSTPVYMLESACGACQNRTFISWTNWHFYCPAEMLADEGTYTQPIPSGTVVPHWAFLKPSDYDDFFDPAAAKLVGDTPESSNVQSSTTARSSTSSLPTTTGTRSNTGGGSPTGSSTTPSSTHTGGGGGGDNKKSSSNTGAIVGGVVGGVVGLALLSLLGFFLFKRSQNNKGSYAPPPSAPPSGATPEMAPVGLAGQYTGGTHATGPGGAGQPQYAQSQYTGNAPTVISGPTNGTGNLTGYYNPNDPSTFPQPHQQPQYGMPPPQQGGFFPPAPQPHPQSGNYSGMPEV